MPVSLAVFGFEDAKGHAPEHGGTLGVGRRMI